MDRRYVPALNRYHALYGRNYHLLQRVLSEPRDVGESFRWQHDSQQVSVFMTVKEQTPYTELIALERREKSVANLPKSAMSIRVYHDAKMAEVLTSQHISRLMAVYPYPNAEMLQRNEKFQVNLFLAEQLVQLCQHQWQIECGSEESRKT